MLILKSLSLNEGEDGLESYSDVTPLAHYLKKSFEQIMAEDLKKDKEAYLQPKSCTISSGTLY